MAATATFAADFGSFNDAVAKATAKLKELGLVPGQVAKQLGSIDRSFSGETLIRQAVNTAEAIERIGGISKLTSSELQRAGIIGKQAADKMMALGVEVPAGIQRLAAAIDPIPQKLTLAERAAGLAKSTFGQMFGAFSAVSLVDRGVSTLINFGKAAFESAGRTVDLSNKLGVSTDAIQRMEFVANQTGGSVEAFASSAFKLSTRLAGGSSSVKAAVEDLGLEFGKLDKLKPEEKFDLVVAALGRIGDASKRNELGVKLFGKSFEQIAGAVAEGYDKIAKESNISTNAQLQALDAAGDAWERFKGRQQKAVQSILGEFALLFEARRKLEADAKKDPKALGDFINRIPTGASNADIEALLRQRGTKGDIEVKASTEANTRAVEDYVKALAKAKAEVAALTREQRTQLNAALELGIKTDELTDRFGISDETLQIYRSTVQQTAKESKGLAKETSEAEEAAKRWESSYRTLNATMGAWVQTGNDANATTKSLLNLYTAMPSAIQSGADSVDIDLIPALRSSNTLLAKQQLNLDEWENALYRLPQAIKSTGVAMEATLNKESELTHFRDGLDEIARAFGTLAQVSGDAMSDISRDIAQAFNEVKLGMDAVKRLSAGGRANTLSGAVEGVAALDSATGSGSRGKRVGSGAATGAALGSFAGPIGTGIGAGVGALVGLFRGQSQGEKTNDLRDQAIAAAGGFDELNRKAAAAGATLDAILKPKKVKDFEKAWADLQEKLGDVEADQQRLNAAIEKYGFTLEELGPKLQKQELDKQAKELIEDWRVLVDAGIGVSKVNERMADTVQDYLNRALRVGAEVPAAMRPILESMAEQGELVDENGDKITDLSKAGVKFSETMTQGFDRIVKKLDELIKRISGTTAAINSVPDLDVNVRYHDPGYTPPDFGGSDLPGFASGTRGRYLDFKSGTPVLLHGRERVMTESEGKSQAAAWGAIASLGAEISALRSDINNVLPRSIKSAILLTGTV